MLAVALPAFNTNNQGRHDRAVARNEAMKREPSETWQEEWHRWTGWSASESYDLDSSKTSQRDIARHFFSAGKASGVRSATRKARGTKEK